MNIDRVVAEGHGDLAGPHAAPVPRTPGNAIIQVEIELPARPGERRVRTQYFELSPSQYRAWCEANARYWED